MDGVIQRFILSCESAILYGPTAYLLDVMKPLTLTVAWHGRFLIEDEIVFCLKKLTQKECNPVKMEWYGT